mmetsp:Transcript_19192/g.43434  ORF Transcript_19192/g.43434 Transcript_19192/m.43434 type:complete len:277 (+) Transcript_19192:360-1190(+)
MRGRERSWDLPWRVAHQHRPDHGHRDHHQPHHHPGGHREDPHGDAHLQQRPHHRLQPVPEQAGLRPPGQLRHVAQVASRDHGHPPRRRLLRAPDALPLGERCHQGQRAHGLRKRARGRATSGVGEQEQHHERPPPQGVRPPPCGDGHHDRGRCHRGQRRLRLDDRQRAQEGPAPRERRHGRLDQREGSPPDRLADQVLHLPRLAHHPALLPSGVVVLVRKHREALGRAARQTPAVPDALRGRLGLGFLRRPVRPNGRACRGPLRARCARCRRLHVL